MKNQIPIPATPILGREKEIEELREMLNKHQVITLTGTGGIGKTRTSLEICHRLKNSYQDGIVFVSMATLTDASEVMPTLADIFGITESASRDLTIGVSHYLKDKKLLLVLDNLEHVISAAYEISELIAKCPGLKILCTSRTPLKIKAEQEYALSPLALPKKEESLSPLNYPSIELFINRAQKVNKDFELTAENAPIIVDICHRMDGLPLTIELAAARLRILSPKQLLQQLNRALDLLTTGSIDAPIRHQTLRATIDWSYALLNAQEQQLFRRLGVFTKGFTIEAITKICYEHEQNNITFIDEVESLVEKALIEKTNIDGRFTLLQTIKDFALEQLKLSGEGDSIFHQHALYYLEFSKILEEGTKGKNQKEQMTKGLLEEANIAAALDYLMDKSKTGDHDARALGLDICGNLWMYWHIRGKHQSAKTYINTLLENSKDENSSIPKCKALFCLHVATFTLGEVKQSLDAALRLSRMAANLKNDLELMKGQFGLGFGHLTENPQLAKNYSHETVAMARKIGDKYWLGFALWQNGLFNLIQGNLEKAEKSYAESLLLFQAIGDNEGKGCAQSGLSMLKFIAGDFEQAIQLYEDTWKAFQTVGDRPEQARILYEMSWAYLALKNTSAALRSTLDSLRAHQEVGSTRGIGLSMNGLAAIEAVKGHSIRAVELAAAAQQFASQKGVAIEFGVSNHGKVYLDNAKKDLSAIEIQQAEKVGSHYTLNDVLRMVEQDFTLSESEELQPLENDFILRLREVMESNFADAEFGVHQLYEAVAMSQMQVYRKLKMLTKQTPSQFIRSYRLQKGKELLRSTEKTVAEIAYEVGFTDPNYFSRAFQKQYNQSPSDYRK